MNQPTDLVSPDEIVAYISERSVTESAATGIKLLRRSAETIAWLTDQLTDMPKDTEAQAKTEQDPEHHHDETLEQVALALGADFTESLPWQYTLDDVLEYIANMQTQLGGLKQGIIERDQIIERYEQPVMSVAEAVAQESKACSTESMSSDTWIKKATSFAHKVHGMTMVMPETKGVHELSLLAHELTDNTPTL